MNVKPEEDLLGCNIADVVVGAGSCIIKVSVKQTSQRTYIMRVLFRPRTLLIGALTARKIKKRGKGGRKR